MYFDEVCLGDEAGKMQIKSCARPSAGPGCWLFPHDMNAASVWRVMFAFSSCRVTEGLKKENDFCIGLF